MDPLERFGIVFFAVVIIALLGLAAVHNDNDMTPRISAITPAINTTAGNLTVTYIDVGQGDSEYLTFPNGKTLLIDTGTGYQKADDNIGTVVKHIDTLVLTHQHADHMGGLEYVESHYNLTVWYTYSTLHRGDFLHIDDAHTTISALNPSSNLPDAENDRSIIIRISYRNVTLQFEGDASSAIEDKLSAGHIDILKVAHHGSSTSTSARFLAATTPRVCVIEVGAGNTYGHPAKDTLARMKAAGCKVYRTDEKGSITVTTNGEQYSVMA